MSRSIIYWLSFLLLLSSSSLIDANRLSTRMDFCWEKIRVTKFFRFHDQIFFTTNSVQYYDNFRLFNLTNGHLSQEFEIPDLGSNSNNNDQQQQLRIIWAFTFDPLNDDNDDYCHNQNNIGPSSSSSTTSTNPYQSYCNRLRKLSDTIIARLSDMNLIYLSYRSGHLIEINNDDEPFLEFESFVKHLDQFGSISSITFDNQNNYYYSIHFVRLNQICMTRINNNNDNNNNEQIIKKNMAIPMLKNLFRKNPYQTDCLQTNRPYSSLINFNNIIYAIVLWFDSPVGYIDHLQLLNKHSNHSNLFEFKQIEQESDKKFFNCYHNSSIIPMMMMNGQKSSINTDVINGDIDKDDVNVEHAENKPSIQLIRNHRRSSSSSASASSKTNHSKISDRMINNQNNNNNQLNSTEQINNIIFWLIITMLILFAVNFCMIKQSGFGFRWLIRHQSTSWDRNRHRRRNNSNHCTRDDGDVTVKKIKKTKTIKKSINNNNNKSIKNNNNNSNSNDERADKMEQIKRLLNAELASTQTPITTLGDFSDDNLDVQ
uniref:Uncharacterized protein n=1 Tax=Dermatophagoides pteronyssinus TaxID=6956 RepID=A0A6P6YAK9_DERPT|nr:putative uncharacterized protein DDB_G0282133 [Dermatophagoides pteronyssinus]